MGRMEKFAEMVAKSQFLAPNLKEMTLRYYTGNKHKGNAIARDIVRNHLLALRWMNPNAVVYLREARGQGTPEVEYELWTAPGSKAVMEIKPRLDADEMVAKILMAARDPADDVEVAGAVASGTATASMAAVSAASAAATSTGAGARAFSTFSGADRGTSEVAAEERQTEMATSTQPELR